MDVAAWAACNNDTTQYADCLPLPPTCMHVDSSLPAPPPPPSPSSPTSPTCTCTPNPHAPPLLAQTAQLPTCHEARLARSHLAGDYTLPAWQDVAAPVAPAPRKHRKAAARAAVDPAHVEFMTGVNTRGYGAPRRKGKPLSKQLVRRELLATSNTKVAVVGPDHVGCTTLLQLLGRQLQIATSSAPRPPPQERLEYHPDHFEALVARWTQLSQQEGPLLIEDSPWAYVAKHTGQITPQ